jgi:protein-disulfide isomerase
MVALGLGGCQKDDKKLKDKLDNMEKKIDQINQQVAAIAKGGGAGRGGQPQQRRGPDPKKVYSIAIENSPGKGHDEPLVVIAKVMEFACPACERARPFVDQLMKEFEGKPVRIVYKNFIVHPTRATIPAQAGCAAEKQGKYKEYEIALWEKGFKARKFDGKPDDTEDVIALAKDTGLDVTKFKADLEGPCKAFVQKEHAAMRKLGVGGTPTFFVNGRVLQRRTVDEVKKMVNEEIAKAEKQIKAGKATAANYYNEFIVKKGAKAM